MILEDEKESILERVNKSAVPTLSAIATIVALARVDDPLIKYPAIVVSVFLAIVVLYPFLRRASLLIGSKLFPKGLGKRQRAKLVLLLKDSTSYVSSNHTYSLFYMWSSYAQRVGVTGGPHQEYHSAIRSHFVDMSDLIGRLKRDQLYILRKMSLAVRDVARAAESMQRDYENALSRGDLDDSLKRQLIMEWNSCASRFNGWIAEWERFFKEANHFSGADCADYIPTVRMLD